jgi:hypothetical protein
MMTTKDHGEGITLLQQQPCKQSLYKAKLRQPKEAHAKIASKEAAASKLLEEAHAPL